MIRAPVPSDGQRFASRSRGPGTAALPRWIGTDAGASLGPADGCEMDNVRRSRGGRQHRCSFAMGLRKSS